MTIIEAISRVDNLKPNIYDQETKIRWLSQLDGQIQQVLFRYDNGSSGFAGYDPDTPLQTQLLLSHPYDSLYQRWLEAQIDLANGEIERYNISITLYNNDYDRFVRDYGRSHMPRSAGQRFRF